MKKCFAGMLICLLFCSPLAAEDFPEKVKQPIAESIKVRQTTQKAEDQWAGQKAKLESEFEALQKEQQQLLKIRDDLGEEVRLHQATVEELQEKIVEIERISEELEPFLENTYTRLAELVDQGAPFLMDERRQRLQNLRSVLDDTQVLTSEKYRKVMEAVFIEAEYGNTIEVYRKRIQLAGKDILVDIFRLGRISLFFQTLDQAQTGYYDRAAGAWKPLPEAFNRDINGAVEIAAKRRTVDMLNLPLGRIVVQ